MEHIQVGNNFFSMQHCKCGYYHVPCGKWFKHFDAREHSYKKTWMNHSCEAITPETIRAKYPECAVIAIIEAPTLTQLRELIAAINTRHCLAEVEA